MGMKLLGLRIPILLASLLILLLPALVLKAREILDPLREGFATGCTL